MKRLLSLFRPNYEHICSKLAHWPGVDVKERSIRATTCVRPYNHPLPSVKQFRPAPCSYDTTIHRHFSKFIRSAIMLLRTGVGSPPSPNTYTCCSHGSPGVEEGSNGSVGNSRNHGSTPSLHGYIGVCMERLWGSSMVNSQSRSYTLHLLTLATHSVMCPLLLHNKTE